MSLANCHTIELPSITDARGVLSIVEDDVQLAFRIRRVYWLHHTPAGATRAGHAHKALMQLVVAVSGSCDVTLDDAFERRTIHLDRPDLGLYIHPLTWRELDNFSSNAALVVLASSHYDESDYIRDYAAFIEATRAQ